MCSSYLWWIVNNKELPYLLFICVVKLTYGKLYRYFYELTKLQVSLFVSCLLFSRLHFVIGRLDQLIESHYPKDSFGIFFKHLAYMACSRANGCYARIHGYV